MKHALLWLSVGISCSVGAVVCAVQFVVAIRYGELGRVLVYFTLGALFLEAAIPSIFRTVRELRKDKRE